MFQVAWNTLGVLFYQGKACVNVFYMEKCTGGIGCVRWSSGFKDIPYQPTDLSTNPPIGGWENRPDILSDTSHLLSLITVTCTKIWLKAQPVNFDANRQMGMTSDRMWGSLLRGGMQSMHRRLRGERKERKKKRKKMEEKKNRKEREKKRRERERD